MQQSSDRFAVERTTADDIALLHFTSGTTGTPKGATHVHGAALMHYATGKYALDLHADDTFWCTADPGWVTGTSYGILAPLLHGVTSLVDEAEFDAERWYRLLQMHAVTVWYTAPTAVRMLMKAGVDLARQYRFPKLRFVASVGEPLNPEAVWWGLDAYHDRQHAGDGHQAGIDGQAATRDRGLCNAPLRRRLMRAHHAT
jgi:acetyl-CoA synthetase